MRGKLLLLVLCLISVMFAQQADSSAQQKKKPVILVLNSYHKGFPWTDDLVRQIERDFTGGDIADLRIEYMDTKHYPGADYFNALYSLYSFKYSSIRFDCIITTDDDALNFVALYHDRLFPSVPVVFCGVNDQQRPWQLNAKYFTGVLEEESPDRTIQLMKKLLPELKQIYVVCDYTTTGRARYSSAQSVIPAFSGLTFRYSPNGTLAEIQKELSSLGSDSAVLLLAFFSDSSGRYFTYEESSSEIRKAASRPVFCISRNYMGSGTLGGVVNSAEAQGDAAFSLCRRILKGESPVAMGVIGSVRNPVMIDYTAAQNHSINLSDLPDGTLFVNKPSGFNDFYLQNRAYVLTLVVVSLFAIIIIMALGVGIVVRMDRKKAEAVRDLQGALSKVKTLSGLLPVCSSCSRIRDADGSWHDLGSYIQENADVEITHSLCPECAERLYPGSFKK